MTRAPLARPTPFEFYGLVRTLNLINLSKKLYLSRGLPHIGTSSQKLYRFFCAESSRFRHSQKKSKKLPIQLSFLPMTGPGDS